MRYVQQNKYVMSCGVETDFSVLIQRFVATQSVRYEHFAEIWREMNFSLIFAGRVRDQEVRQFTEECLNMIKTYLQPTNEFQVQIGALYLLYAVYFKQLFEPKVKIRMTMTQWSQLQSLITEVRAQNHSDIEYIYHRLIYHKAFQMTAHSTELSLQDRDSFENMSTRLMKAAQLATSADHDKMAQRSLLTDMAEGDAVDQLSSVHEQYHRVKCALVGPNAKKPSASMDMIDPNIVQHITKKIASFEWWKKYKAGKRGSRRRHDSGPTTSESEADSESERAYSPKKSRSQGSIRAEIKARAMGVATDVSRSRRHRTVRSLSTLEEESPGSSSTPSRGQQRRGKRSHESSDEEQPSTTLDSKDGVLNMPTFQYLEEPEGKKKKQTRKRKGQPKAPKTKASRKIKNQPGDDTLNSSVEGKTAGGTSKERTDDVEEESGTKKKRKRQRKTKAESTETSEQTPSKPVHFEQYQSVSKNVPGDVDTTAMDVSGELGDLSTNNIPVDDSKMSSTGDISSPISPECVVVSEQPSTSRGKRGRKRTTKKKK